MARHTYRTILIGAAFVLGLAASGSLAADDIGDDEDRTPRAAAPVDRDIVVVEEEVTVYEPAPASAEFARLERVGGEWLRPRFVVHPGPHGPQ